MLLWDRRAILWTLARALPAGTGERMSAYDSRLSMGVPEGKWLEKMGFVRVRETEVDPDLGWSGVEYEKTR